MQLNYATERDEKVFGDTLEALVMEFGPANVKVSFPAEFLPYKEELQIQAVQTEFSTLDTFEISVPGTQIKHVTQLVRTTQL